MILELALLFLISANIAVSTFLFIKLNKLTENRKSVLEDIEKQILSNNNNLTNLLQIQSNSQYSSLELIANRINEFSNNSTLLFKDIRDSITNAITSLQKDNSSKLDKMRETVEEKLQSTLEKRLSESFQIVSSRLEMVHKGLGEMQVLAVGVGDLKKVLTNIKVRGVWGEVQLEALMSQILTSDQYEKNVQVIPSSSGRVEFAVKLPGNNNDIKNIWLPIDSKFPIEEFHKLIEAEESGDKNSILMHSKGIELAIKDCAKNIFTKYISPPYTTDFAIMFIPIESLYAEIIKKPGIIESLQRDYRVIITGPTTLAAILNSLQMGFKTLAIEKRSSEIWTILGSVKQEFSKFGDILSKTREKLELAGRTIGMAEQRARVIQKKLTSVASNDIEEEQQDQVTDLLSKISQD